MVQPEPDDNNNKTHDVPYVEYLRVVTHDRVEAEDDVGHRETHSAGKCHQIRTAVPRHLQLHNNDNNNDMAIVSENVKAEHRL